MVADLYGAYRKVKQKSSPTKKEVSQNIHLPSIAQDSEAETCIQTAIFRRYCHTLRARSITAHKPRHSLCEIARTP